MISCLCIFVFVLSLSVKEALTITWISWVAIIEKYESNAHAFISPKIACNQYLKMICGNSTLENRFQSNPPFDERGSSTIVVPNFHYRWCRSIWKLFFSLSRLLAHFNRKSFFSAIWARIANVLLIHDISRCLWLIRFCVLSIQQISHYLLHYVKIAITSNLRWLGQTHGHIALMQLHRSNAYWTIQLIRQFHEQLPL